MPIVIVLDATPLGLLTTRRGKTAGDNCREWLADCIGAGIRVVVPEIADYEIRRELVRSGKEAGIARLDAFNTAEPDRYLPLTTVAMRRAADLWAQARNAGVATADVHALDADAILAAQALSLGLPTGDVVVATGNVRHLSRFISADLWSNIRP